MPTRVENTSKVIRYVNETLLNGVVVSSSPASHTIPRSLSITSGPTHAMWRQKLAAYPVWTGPMDVSVSKETLVGGLQGFAYTVRTSTGDVRSYRGGLVPAPPPTLATFPADLTTACKNIVIGKALKRFHAERRAIQGGVFFGEIAETLMMLRRPFDLIRGRTDHMLTRTMALRRVANYRSWRKAGKRVQEAFTREYLGYIYGISPFIKDINAIGQWYNTHWNNPKHGFKIIRVAHELSEQASAPFSALSTYPDGRRLLSNRHATVTARIKLRTAVEASAGPGALFNPLTVFGLEARDIIPSAWELLPLSFVVDGAVNIGQVLDSWSYASCFPSGVQLTEVKRFLGFSTSKVLAQVPFPPSLTLVGISDNVPKRIREVTTIKRYSQGSLPVAKLQFRLPSDASTYFDWANVVAALLPKVKLKR